MGWSYFMRSSLAIWALSPRKHLRCPRKISYTSRGLNPRSLAQEDTEMPAA